MPAKRIETEREAQVRASRAVLRGWDAIEAAEAGEPVRLNKYADPVEGERLGLSAREAREVAREDPYLIWGEE